MKATMAWRCHACDGFVERLLIAIQCPLDEGVTEWYQEPKPVLEDEDADPEEEEFEEEEEPQEEDDDDMEVDIEEDENEPELTYLYKEVDPLNPSPPASESEPEDVIEMAHALVEKKGKAKDKYYGKLILDLGNKVRSSVEQGTTAMEKLVERLGNAKDKVECKKLMKELEKERLNEAIDILIKDEKSPTSEP
ncbi:hypothetical protein Tco_0502304 [Tanacetum coccineum]